MRMRKYLQNCLLFSFEHVAGYSYAVDWWSLGIVAYEMRAGSRPFVIHSTTPIEDVKETLFSVPAFPRHWSVNFIELIRKVNFINVLSSMYAHSNLFSIFVLVIRR